MSSESQFSVQCSNPRHQNYQITSICLQNSKEPAKLWTLNCTECVKEISAKIDTQQLRFHDYPQKVFKIFEQFQDYLLSDTSSKIKTSESESNASFLADPLNAKFDSLASELQSIADFYLLTIEKVQQAKISYNQQAPASNFIPSVQLYISEVTHVLKTSNDQHFHEEQLMGLSQFFDLDNGEAFLKKEEKDENFIINQQREAMLFCQALNDTLQTAQEEINKINQDPLLGNIEGFRAYKRQPEIEINFEQESLQITQMKAKIQQSEGRDRETTRLLHLFETGPVPVCQKNHLQSKITSIILENRRDTSTRFTLNCGQCIKQLSTQIGGEAIVFRDYPETITNVIKRVKNNEFREQKLEINSEENDPIEQKYDALILQIIYYSDYLKDSIETLKAEQQKYMRERRVASSGSQQIDQFLQIIETITLSQCDKDEVEKNLRQLTEVLIVKDSEIQMVEDELQTAPLLAKQAAIQYCRDFSTSIEQVVKILEQFDKKFLKRNLVPFQRNLKLDEETEKLLPQLLKILEPQQPIFISESEMLQQSQIETLKKWVQLTQFENLKLLFRSSTHGFVNFHNYCDGKPNTLIILKSDIKDIMFGGFTPVPWSSRGVFEKQRESMNGRKTFLFSLTHDVTLPMKEAEKDYAIFGYPVSVDDLFAFGRGFDLQVSRKNQKGTSNLGQSYEIPQGLSYDTHQARSFLGGAAEFKIIEVEVYAIEES